MTVSTKLAKKTCKPFSTMGRCRRTPILTITPWQRRVSWLQLSRKRPEDSSSLTFNFSVLKGRQEQTPTKSVSNLIITFHKIFQTTNQYQMFIWSKVFQEMGTCIKVLSVRMPFMTTVSTWTWRTPRKRGFCSFQKLTIEEVMMRKEWISLRSTNFLKTMSWNKSQVKKNLELFLEGKDIKNWWLGLISGIRVFIMIEECRFRNSLRGLRPNRAICPVTCSTWMAD